MKDVASCDKPRGAANRHYIRGFPNGKTQRWSNPSLLLTEYIGEVEQTQGSETSQYLKEEKSIEIPVVAASETGIAQTDRASA